MWITEISWRDGTRQKLRWEKEFEANSYKMRMEDLGFEVKMWKLPN